MRMGELFNDRFPLTDWTVDSEPPPPTAHEVAAQRLARPYAKAKGEMGQRIGEVAEFLKPETPLDYALTFGTGGAGLLGKAFLTLPKAARVGTIAGGALTTADAAQGGPLDKIVKPVLKKADESGAAGARLGELFAEPKAPAIVSRAKPTQADVDAIKAYAARMKDEPWPDAPPSQQVFKTTPEAYAETTELVPQVSVKGKLPGPLPGEELPAFQRAAPVVWNTDQIAEMVANRLRPFVREQSPLLKFYHTGPVIKGLGGVADMSTAEANQFMRDWAGQGAATSPRTKTPRNLRNSSYLMYENARGEPFNVARWEAEGNAPGFPMMRMHVNLADQFRAGTENPWTNPKPFTFRENWSGNLSDVTGDTHNIRGTLFELDRLTRSVPSGWFTSPEAYQRARHMFRNVDPGDIKDTLEGRTVNKEFRQSEYLPMVEPWYRAAQILGVKPAEAQSGGWFSYGPITRLRSPPKTITNLLNDQIAATANEIGVSPQKAASWWGRGLIPLGGIGAGMLGTKAMSDLASQNNYEQ